MIYKAQVTLFIKVPDGCQDPDSFVADALSAQLSENGIYNPYSEIADWHYALAPGTPSGYVWPKLATAEDLAETELLGRGGTKHPHKWKAGSAWSGGSTCASCGGKKKEGDSGKNRA